MKNAKAALALKDKNFRAQLSASEQAQLGSRVGIAEIDASLLDVVAGASNGTGWCNQTHAVYGGNACTL
jgi:hypothetical protein